MLVAALDFAVLAASPPRWTRAPMVFRPTPLLQPTPALFWTLLFICAALLLAGVGLVRRKEWGRRLSLLVLGVAIAVLAVACLCLVDVLAALHIPGYRPSSVDRTLTLTAGLITAAALAAACALAGWIAWRLTRQRCKREFSRPAGSATNEGQSHE